MIYLGENLNQITVDKWGRYSLISTISLITDPVFTNLVFRVGA